MKKIQGYASFPKGIAGTEGLEGSVIVTGFLQGLCEMKARLYITLRMISWGIE